MANWYVSSVDYTAVAQWAAVHTYAVGNIVRQLAAPSVGNERCFRVTSITTGVSGASEPAWSLSKGATTSETTVTWTEVTGNETYQAVGAWGAPHARLLNMLNWMAAGDSGYVAKNHAETQSASMTLIYPGTISNPCYVYCVDNSGTGHVPSTSADLSTTATVTTTGSNALDQQSGFAWIQGVKFSASTSSSGGSSIGFGSSTSDLRYKNCALQLSATSAVTMFFGSSGSGRPCRVTFDNTTFQVSATGSSIEVDIADFIWKNTASAITGATLPTTLFKATSGAARILCEGVDLSALGSGKTLVAAQGASGGKQETVFKDCKFGASVTIAATPSNNLSRCMVLRSDSGATNNRAELHDYYGDETTETTLIRTGGASDGMTGFSHKFITTANSRWTFPFEPMPYPAWNNITAANVTVTVEGIFNAAALPNNDDIWIDVEYLGSSATPLGSFGTSSKADNLAAGSALTASTQAWDSLVAARANSTTYAVGDMRKVATNTGRVFIVTAQTGASAGSEPGGFATAVDGGAVTDGNVTWRAMMRFKTAVTMSSPQPGLIGELYVYPKVAKASTTYYLDPLPTLS